MVCFHHNDIDGFASAAILKNYCSKFYSLGTNNRFIEMTYDTFSKFEQALEGESVFILDVSISSENSHILTDLFNKGCKVTICDHHKSTFDMFRENPSIANQCSGLFNIKYSGAALTYMYLHREENFDFRSLPLWVRLISDFDTWTHNLEQSILFKYAIESFDYSLASDIWESLLEDGARSSSLVKELITEGLIIERYFDRQSRLLVETNSYELFFEGHRCLVLNAKGSSLLFGDSIHKYPIVVLWTYNGKEYRYSLYSDGAVDVAEIAARFGGGGHKNASGFQSSKFLF